MQGSVLPEHWRVKDAMLLVCGESNVWYGTDSFVVALAFKMLIYA